jgi:ribonuclease HII
MPNKAIKHSVEIDKAGRALPERISFSRPSFIIGIDEVGRGSLAGPVIVAGIKISAATSLKFKVKSLKLRDSKKLSAKQREEWFRILTANPKIEWAVAGVRAKTIDKINIAQAANLGALRVYRKLSVNKESIANKRINELQKERLRNAQIQNSLIRKSIKKSLCADTVFLDGGLKLPSYIPHKVIIKGDEKIPVISAASIIAKVIRDRIMLRFHKRYPQYRFDLHKGYGTKLHRNMIQKFGRSDIHRLSFVFKI